MVGCGGNNASEDLDEKSTCLYTRAGRKPRGHKKHQAFSPHEGGEGGGVGQTVGRNEGRPYKGGSYTAVRCTSSSSNCVQQE